ncbi:hypothetical protein C8F04DRAFT_1124903 [Mycena alexandri]|uniref:Uncharacterized protein n=1 Tax=Mycena alexandri TaxID=1745969 RepID=A0AAD6SEL7_9AGAR|nr:hypothetical protein C8F04DRAFT_1124903 [Mycena alexandri]
MTECARDPHFLCETGLKLTETNYTLSTLRARTIGMKYIPWKAYPYQLITIGWALYDCRRDMEDLRSSILLALEFSRQQIFREDIEHRLGTLASAFHPGCEQSLTTQRRSWTRMIRPVNEQTFVPRQPETLLTSIPVCEGTELACEKTKYRPDNG